ncbi:hypothetical protein JW823_09750 [bacterium]|nr:hypothetical protein [candidate division CSSED10-310 bacterium]
MLDAIRSTLGRDKRISGWTILEHTRDSYQIYTSLKRQEAIRAVSQKRWKITIFSPLPGQTELVGQTDFELVEGEQRLDRRLEMAIEQARLHGNPPFKLPSPGAQYPDFDDSDPDIRDRPWDTLGILNDAIEESVDRESNIELASSELFLDELRHRLLTSSGLDLHLEKSHVTWDVCLLYNKAGSETEFWEMKTRPGARYLDVKSDISRFAGYARDAAPAIVPRSGNCPVVLTGDHLFVLLQYFLHHSSASAKYNNSSLFSPGKPVLPDTPRGDPLTLFSNALHPGGIFSYRFDGEGSPGDRIPIIENGNLSGFWGTSQYSEYLNLPTTGSFANFEIPAGKVSWDDLFKSDDRVILVLQFSTFDPQPVAGNYLGEIRVGYEFRKDGSVVPLRGGSVTGNVVDGMLDCRFCSELDTFYGYHGPRGIRFERAQIAGD